MHREPQKDYYKLLGVDPKASIEKIKKAYKERAKETHPDKTAQNGLTIAEAEKRFKEIQEAYEILSDSIKRFIYDFDNIPQSTSTESEFKGFSGFSFDFDSSPQRVNCAKLGKRVEKLFASSSLEKLARDNIDVRNYRFETEIVFCKGDNRERGLKKFIEAKANVNAKDPKLGKTALHWAVEKNALCCVKILLSNGAENSIVDTSGKKPSDYSGITPEMSSLLNPETARLSLES